MKILLIIILIAAFIYLFVAALAFIFFGIVATSQGERGDVKEKIRDALLWPAYLVASIFPRRE